MVAPPERQPHFPVCPVLQGLEQVEVEGAFITAGALLPGAHSFYWLGLHVTDLPWPNFVWLDPQLPAPAVRGGSGGPSHWGTVVLEGGVFRVAEPNANYFGRDESCAGEAGWGEMS
jgi:hypothetical protein